MCGGVAFKRINKIVNLRVSHMGKSNSYQLVATWEQINLYAHALSSCPTGGARERESLAG